MCVGLPPPCSDLLSALQKELFDAVKRGNLAKVGYIDKKELEWKKVCNFV